MLEVALVVVFVVIAAVVVTADASITIVDMERVCRSLLVFIVVLRVLPLVVSI